MNMHRRPDRTSRLGVLRADGEYRLIAHRPLRAGAFLFALSGVLRKTPTRSTMQVDVGLHLEVPYPASDQQIMDNYAWRYMNHSCEPNVRIQDRQAFAMTDIGKGTQLTCNYNTTTAALVEPFDCHCGSSRCVGRIAGYSAASEEERDRLWPWTASYLLTETWRPVNDAEDPHRRGGR